MKDGRRNENPQMFPNTGMRTGFQQEFWSKNLTGLMIVAQHSVRRYIYDGNANKRKLPKLELWRRWKGKVEFQI